LRQFRGPVPIRYRASGLPGGIFAHHFGRERLCGFALDPPGAGRSRRQHDPAVLRRQPASGVCTSQPRLRTPGCRAPPRSRSASRTARHTTTPRTGSLLPTHPGTGRADVTVRAPPGHRRRTYISRGRSAGTRPRTGPVTRRGQRPSMTATPRTRTPLHQRERQAAAAAASTLAVGRAVAGRSSPSPTTASAPVAARTPATADSHPAPTPKPSSYEWGYARTTELALGRRRSRSARRGRSLTGLSEPPGVRGGWLTTHGLAHRRTLRSLHEHHHARSWAAPECDGQVAR
jgi:hypothetical protein